MKNLILTLLALLFISCGPEQVPKHNDELVVIQLDNIAQYTYTDFRERYDGKITRENGDRYTFWINGNDVRVQGPGGATAAYFLTDTMDKEGTELEISEKNSVKVFAKKDFVIIKFVYPEYQY